MVQETRLYDPDRRETRSMRSKEDAHDYRYFPDPDLAPLAIDAAWIERVRQTLPELPEAMQQRFAAQYGLAPYDAGVLTASKASAEYFEAVVAQAGTAQAKTAANWIMGELASQLNRDGLEIGACPVSAAQLAGLILRIADGTVSNKIAKEVFLAIWDERAADAGAADGSSKRRACARSRTRANSRRSSTTCWRPMRSRSRNSARARRRRSMRWSGRR